MSAPNANAYTRQYGYTDATGNDFGDLTRVSSAPITTTRGANSPITTGYAYDQDGNVITTTTPNGASVVATYDHLGRPTRTTQPGVALSVLGPTVTINTSTGYDGDSYVITTTDSAGDLTRAVYDALGRTIQTVNPVGAAMAYTYSGPVLTDMQNTLGQRTHYDYDGADRLIGVTDPLGVHTQYSPDAVGNTTASTTPLDANGQSSMVDTRAYDALNRATTETVAGTGETGSSAAQTTTTSYDADGNVAQVQAPNGDVTYHTYDILDRPQWSEVDPGLLTAPPTGSVAPPASEAYGFDAADNLTYQNDFNTRAHQLSYDAANRLIAQTDQPSCGGCAIAAITTTLGADADGNVTRATRQEGTALPTTTTTQYNTADWALSQDDGLGATYTAYDTAGRVVGQSLGVGAGALTAGQVNLYDKEGRVMQTWDGVRGASPATTMSAFTYNAADLPVTTTVPSINFVETRGYDRDNRLARLEGHRGGIDTVYSYGYTPQGRTLAITTDNSGGLGIAGAVNVETLNTNALGQFSADYNSRIDTESLFRYDGNGNILETDQGNPRPLVTPGPIATYAYTASDGSEPAGWLPNELVSCTASGQTTRYGYDQAGDTTTITYSDGTADHLSYDAAGRLGTAVTASGARAMAVTYNARGLRDSYTITDQGGGAPLFRERFTYRGGQVGRVAVTGAATTSFTETFVYRADGLPLEMLREVAGTPGVQRYWYVLDGQGSVVALFDQNGALVCDYTYDAWGAPLTAHEDSGIHQPLRYRGYWYDGWDNSAGSWNGGALPWYWLTTRYYDAALTRFLQPDPSSRDGVRSYVYCHDDPVDLADPSGLAGEPAPGGDTSAEGVPGASAGSAGSVVRLRQHGRRHGDHAHGRRPRRWPITPPGDGAYTFA